MTENTNRTKSSTELIQQVKQEFRSDVDNSSQDEKGQPRDDDTLKIKNGANTVLFFGVLSFLYSVIVTIMFISWLLKCRTCHNDECGNCIILLFVPLYYFPSVIAFIVFGVVSHFVKKRLKGNYDGNDYLSILNRRRACGFFLLLISAVVSIILTLVIFLLMFIH